MIKICSDFQRKKGRSSAPTVEGPTHLDPKFYKEKVNDKTFTSHFFVVENDNVTIYGLCLGNQKISLFS